MMASFSVYRPGSPSVKSYSGTQLDLLSNHLDYPCKIKAFFLIAAFLVDYYLNKMNLRGFQLLL